MKAVILLCCFIVAKASSSSPEENLGVSSHDVELFGGDIALTPEQKSVIDGETKGSITNKRWPNGVVVYVVESSLSSSSSAMSAIRDGMADWTQKTCIRFKKRTSEADYVSFFRGSGCWSYVGKIGGKQKLSLASGCWHKGVVAHEIGHALGLFHEQSRPDRDKFVTIKYENIKDSAKSNFNKYGTNVINSMGTPYDYGSVMHYGSRYFSKNGQPTIVPKKAGVTIGNRAGISAIDAKQMNLMYQSCSVGPGSCGSRPPLSRIVGGKPATKNSWPWQAMLVTSSGRQFCGGSLIHPLWVVTAAHCVSGWSPFSVKVKMGAHYRVSGSVGTEQTINVAQIISHEKYHKPMRYAHDIALLKLAKPAVLGKGVGLVCLSNPGNVLPIDNVNKKCWITGWGTLSSGGNQSNVLQEASVPLVSKLRCLKAYPGKIGDSMLCAGLDKGGVDSCQGDSGGPLVCEFNGKWHLEGVTSWGYGCASPNKYGVYARVGYVRSWVLNKTGITAPGPNPPTPPPPQSGCSFDGGLCPGMKQSAADKFDWSLKSGRTPSASTGPSSGHGGKGNYIYFETSSPVQTGDNAKLELNSSGGSACLTFYYHMYGSGMGTLNVFDGSSRVFTQSGDKGNTWHKAEVTVKSNKVTFEGIRGNSYRSDIALDDVLLKPGGCGGGPSPPTSPPPSPGPGCSFDGGLCPGMKQSAADKFDWSLKSGSTPSAWTGPSSGHGGKGNYIYFETSSPVQTGDNAKLELNSPGGSACLTFYYHMYGSGMGTLNVFDGSSRVFTQSGDKGNTWHKAEVTVRSNKVTFEGIRGNSYRSDIALDDVLITSGACRGGPSPPTPPPPSPGPGCVDNPKYADICPSIASCGNYCNNHKVWAQKNCPKSCNMCPPGPVTPAPPTPAPCGRSPVTRVIGGVDAKPGNWPWQIALLRGSSKSFSCGGSLIAPDWVVTAAHCISRGQLASYYTVRLGDHNRYVSEGTEQDITAKRVIVHPQYSSSTLDKDIALIQLSKSATLNSRVGTVCLPVQDEMVSTSARCFITGWGKIKHPGSSHNILQQAQMPPVTNNACQSKLASSPGGTFLKITPYMLCAGKKRTILSGCHGDSGGPYVCKGLMETGFYRVTSAGAPQDALRLSDTLCLGVLQSSGTGSTRS